MHKKSTSLTRQQLHELGIKWVYKHIKDDYEILSVNMEFDTNPQILARKDDQLHFILVRTDTYPDLGYIPGPVAEQVINHAHKHKGKCLFARVGVANADAQTDEGMGNPVKDGSYYINYDGLKETPFG